MKRSRLIIVTMLAAIVLILSYALSRKNEKVSVGFTDTSASATPKSTSFPASPQNAVSATPYATATEQENRARRIVSAVFDAPISFFGRVQDQKGVPIVEAKVAFGAIDKFWESGNNYYVTSDAKGLFSINGIKGAGLTVAVSKEGYDGINGLSYQSFGYGMPPDSTRKPPPSRDAPAVFVLRMKSPAEPLVTLRRDIILPKDGTPVEISLTNGKQVGNNNGDVVFQCWTTDDPKDAQGRYPWHARISIPGGGLMERRDTELVFEAPEEGYASGLEINMLEASLQWREDNDREYWFKLRNGIYGRMRCRITTGGGHFVSITSYLNPSRSRNLEYDENKVIR